MLPFLRLEKDLYMRAVIFVLIIFLQAGLVYSKGLCSVANVSKAGLFVDQYKALTQLDTYPGDMTGVRVSICGKGESWELPDYGRQCKYSTNDGRCLHYSYSVTKSVLGILMGIALEKNFNSLVTEDNPYRTVHKKLGELQQLDEFWLEEINDEKSKKLITLHELLTMTSGFDWSEAKDSSTWTHNKADNKFDKFAAVNVGNNKRFNYSTASSDLLAFAITGGFKCAYGDLNNTAYSLRSLAKEFLFQPLGIGSEFQWNFDVMCPSSSAVYEGGTGLYLSLNAMDRLGQLLLDKGAGVVSEQWLSLMLGNASNSDYPTLEEVQSYSMAQFKHTDPVRAMYKDIALGYGYQWWVVKDIFPNEPQAHDRNIYYAIGVYGQFIAVIPKADMVVSSTHANANTLMEDPKSRLVANAWQPRISSFHFFPLFHSAILDMLKQLHIEQ